MVSYSLTTSQERAILRAVVEGTEARAIGGGVFLTTSTSRPGTFHRTTAASCTCEAGLRGLDCKHRAAAILASESHRCHHCGHSAGDVDRFNEHIGGVGDAVTVYLCQDRAACWNRWERRAS